SERPAPRHEAPTQHQNHADAVPKRHIQTPEQPSIPTRRTSDLDESAHLNGADEPVPGPEPPRVIDPARADKRKHRLSRRQPHRRDRKSTRLTPVTVRSRMPSSA